MALNNAAPVSDDYIGALLRIEGVPDSVVIPLLQSSNCNVEGLRNACANGQQKTALDLGLGNRTDQLDGFPGKVREVFIKLGIISTPVQQQSIQNACNDYTNRGLNAPRPEMKNPAGMGPLILDEETKSAPSEGGSWSSPNCWQTMPPLPGTGPGPGPGAGPGQGDATQSRDLGPTPYIAGVNPMHQGGGPHGAASQGAQGPGQGPQGPGRGPGQGPGPHPQGPGPHPHPDPVHPDNTWSNPACFAAHPDSVPHPGPDQANKGGGAPQRPMPPAGAPTACETTLAKAAAPGDVKLEVAGQGGVQPGEWE